MSNFRRILKGCHFVLLFTFMCPFAGYAQAASQAAMKPQEPPTSWIDPSTGHKVVPITREPDSASFYFNVNSYTPDRREMVYTTPDGISVIDLSTWKTRSVVHGKVRTVVVGHKTPSVFYIKADDRALYVANPANLDPIRTSPSLS